MSLFAERAARLAGMAGALLHWGPAQFWAATPEELAGILAALAGADGGTPPPPDPATLASLKERFPDG